MKKQAKKDKFSTSEVGALIDQLRGEFKVFGESLSDLREKFDALTGMVAEHEEKSTWSRLEIGTIKGDLTKINGKLARIEESTRSIKDNLKSKVDRKDFETLEKKVASFTT